MNYQFIQETKNEPDLKDVALYLNNPLLVAEEIMNKYDKSSVQIKNNIENRLNIQQLKKLIEKDLFNMMKNYCQLTLKYRNQHILKTTNINNNEVNYTAKDLLLKNVAKIIEEITILEEKINTNISMELLVQTRMLNNIGSHVEFKNGHLHSEETQLENKFNYENFISTTKPQLSLKKQALPEVEKVFVKETINKEMSFFKMTLSIFAVTVTAGFFMINYINTNQDNQKIYSLLINTEDLKNNIQSINLTASLNNKIPLNSYKNMDVNDIYKVIDNKRFKNSFGNTILVKEENNKYSMKFTSIPKDQCPYIISKFHTAYEKPIKVNNKDIKTFNKETLINSCNKNGNDITIVNII